MDCKQPPEHVAQLASHLPTRGSDCGVAATIMALDFATCGELRRGIPAVREAMGQRDGATNTTQQEQALRAFALDDDRLGRLKRRRVRPPQIQRRVCVPFREAVRALENGKGLVVSIGYRPVNTHRPDLSGQLSFNDYHSVFVDRSRVRDGEREWRVWDPLYDDGPKWWPEWLMRKAAAKMRIKDGLDENGEQQYTTVGRGRILFIKVRRQRAIPEGQPDDGPDDVDTDDRDEGVIDAGMAGGNGGMGALDPAARIAMLEASLGHLGRELDAMEAENDAAAERIAALERALQGVAQVASTIVSGAGDEDPA